MYVPQELHDISHVQGPPCCTPQKDQSHAQNVCPLAWWEGSGNEASGIVIVMWGVWLFSGCGSALPGCFQERLILLGVPRWRRRAVL